MVFGASWFYYMRTITYGELDIFGMAVENVNVFGLVLLFIDILVVMVAMSTLGLVLGGLVRDTKSAGIVVGPIWFIAVMGALAIQFVGVPTSSIGFAMLSAALLPSPVLSYIALLLGNPEVLFTALAINSVEAVVLIYLLGKFLEGEAMIIGWRFSRPRARE